MNNRALILALNEHNQAIARSRAEYAAHPNAACGANDYGTLCHDLRTDDDYYCPAHRAVRAPGSRRRAA